MKHNAFYTNSVVSISTVCPDDLAAEIKQNEDIREETFRRCYAIPSYQHKSRAWKNRYYDHFRKQVIREIETLST